MRIAVLTLVLFPIVGASHAQSVAPAGPIVFVNDKGYPPHSYLEDGVAKGSEIEVAQAVAKAIGRDVEIRLLAWSEAQRQVLAGNADAVLDLSVTDERKQAWDFTDPIFTHEFCFFIRTNEVGISKLSDLQGKRVGVIAGSLPEAFLRPGFGQGLVLVGSYDDGFVKLSDGALDAVAADSWVGAYIIQQRRLQGLTMVPEPFAVRQAGIAVRKGNAALLAEMNRAVRQLTADGTLARIHDRWRPQEIVFVSRERFRQYEFWGIGGGALLVLAGLAFWIGTLRRSLSRQADAATALRAAEERFEKAFLASPSCIAISDFERGVLEINQRFEELTGYQRSEILGRNLSDLGLTGAEQRAALLAGLRERGSVRDVEFQIRKKNGAVAFVRWSAEILQIGGRECFLSVISDVTDRHRLEASLQQASEINRLLVSELESEPLYEAITRSVGVVLRLDYAGVVLYDLGTKTLELRAHTFYDQRGMIPTVNLGGGRTPSSVALERGELTVFNRQELEAFGPIVGPLLEGGIRTFCCSPLVGRHGPIGTLAVGSRRDDAFSVEDLAVIRQLSSYVAISIANARTYDELKSLKNQVTEEKLYLEEEIRVERHFEDIIGTSAALLRTLQQIETVAPTESTVLLLGETGTGKELLARAVHQRSLRRSHTFVKVNAAALPATLLESELFGYERGAFTGAVGNKVGRFELANRGTLFLDEIGDVPLELQPKLLRVLQEREFERLGGTRTVRVDVRMIAATNRDLESMVADGTFRRDLYYRLNVFPILVPALRDRPEDIPMLVRHFVQRFSTKLKRRIDTIPAGAMAALTRWPWPGNIRELENVIERAVIISTGSELQVPVAEFTSSAPKPVAPVIMPSGQSYEDVEREAILRALRDANGIIAGDTGAAARLGLKRTTLQSRMRKLGINRPSY